MEPIAPRNQNDSPKTKQVHPALRRLSLLVIKGFIHCLTTFVCEETLHARGFIYCFSFFIFFHFIFLFLSVKLEREYLIFIYITLIIWYLFFHSFSCFMLLLSCQQNIVSPIPNARHYFNYFVFYIPTWSIHSNPTYVNVYSSALSEFAVATKVISNISIQESMSCNLR